MGALSRLQASDIVTFAEIIDQELHTDYPLASAWIADRLRQYARDQTAPGLVAAQLTEALLEFRAQATGPVIGRLDQVLARIAEVVFLAQGRARSPVN